MVCVIEGHTKSGKADQREEYMKDRIHLWAMLHDILVKASNRGCHIDENYKDGKERRDYCEGDERTPNRVCYGGADQADYRVSRNRDVGGPELWARSGPPRAAGASQRAPSQSRHVRRS